MTTLEYKMDLSLRKVSELETSNIIKVVIDKK